MLSLEFFTDENLDFMLGFMFVVFFLVVIYRIVFDIYCAKNVFSKIDDFNENLKNNKNKRL